MALGQLEPLFLYLDYTLKMQFSVGCLLTITWLSVFFVVLQLSMKSISIKHTFLYMFLQIGVKIEKTFMVLFIYNVISVMWAQCIYNFKQLIV